VTHAVTVAISAALRKPECDGVESTARMGARSLRGSVATSPDGETQAIAPRNEVAFHPAAGDDPPWQLTQ
jgi:hypothetical protein